MSFIRTATACLLLTALSVFSTSCDLSNTTPEGEEQRVEILTNSEALNERMEFVDRPIMQDASNSGSNESFQHIANLRTPRVDGRKLSATAIHTHAKYAYVSYQLHGKDYGGAIDIVDVSDADEPKIVETMKFANTDLNDITLQGNRAYVTGGRKMASSGYDAEDHNGAIIAEIKLRGNKSFTENIQETPLESYSGNSVEIEGNSIVVSTGSGGGFYILNRQNLTVEGGIKRERARHIDIENNGIVGLALNLDYEGETPNTSKLYRFSGNSGSLKVDSLDTDMTMQPENGKNVIDYRNGLVYAALSNQGYKVYDFDNPSSPVASFNLKADGLANGLDASDDYLYMAAGSEGLYVGALPNLEEVFSWDNEEGSANYVEASGRHIFLAKGTNSLNILKRVEGDDD